MTSRRFAAGLLPAVMLTTLVLVGTDAGRAADDLSALVADRAAVERVYFTHRLGQHGTFEQSLPAAVLESLVKSDLNKEAVLENVYRVSVTDEMVEAEVRRIDSTTRAPAVLAELKAALDNDPVRFARTVARPIVVDRVLRERFVDDESLHATQREQVEQARAQLLAAKKSGAGAGQLLDLLRRGHSNEVLESTWLLTRAPPVGPLPDRIRPNSKNSSVRTPQLFHRRTIRRGLAIYTSRTCPPICAIFCWFNWERPGT